jgi:hypothetical protein
MLSRFAPVFQFQVRVLLVYDSRPETIAQKASTSSLESTLEAAQIEIEPEPIRADTKLDTSAN